MGDTNDSTLNYGMDRNIDFMHREAKRIAASHHLPLHVAIFEGFNTRLDSFLSFIDNLEIAPDDIVVLYINNHGHRNQDKDNQWPDLLFSIDQAVNPSYYTLDFKIVFEKLKNKNPRFLLCMAEACNSITSSDDSDDDRDTSNDSDDDWDSSDDSDDESEDSTQSNEDVVANSENILHPTGPSYEARLNADDVTLRFVRMLQDKTDRKFYQNLFGNKTGTILVSSSSPGESSVNNLFLTIFLSELDHQRVFCVQSEQYYIDEHALYGTWECLLSQVKQKVSTAFKYAGFNKGKQENQTVQYEINVQ